MRKKPVIILLVLLLQLAKGAGQNFPDLQFEHITAKDGLSSNAVTAIAEDKLGFMWIGTANGLNRYDGYRFKQYFHSNTDSNSLVNNTVQHIICDSRGRLWISTEDGISCFIPAENRFVNFSVKFKVPYHLKNNSGIKPYEDETGTVWLCNQESSVYKVLPGMTLEEVRLDLPAFTFFHLSPLGYDNIFRDRAGNEWAFKANRIYKLNKATRQPQETIDCYPLLNAFILKMMQDDRGNYFIATFGGGFLQFLPGQKKKMDDWIGNKYRLVSFRPRKRWNKNIWHCCRRCFFIGRKRI
jgi:ligand-binding sensor domain-containing protein